MTDERSSRLDGLIATPHPVPGRLWPALGGGTIVLLALPVFLVTGWPLAGWGLAAILWAGAQALTAVLTRLPLGAGNLAAAGMRGIGTGLRAFAVGVPLVAATVADERIGLAALAVYVVAFSAELALSLLAFFSVEAPA